MIDVTKETLIPLRELARMIPGRNGKPIAVSTVWRWALNGRRGHKLRTVQIGGGRYTTAGWWTAYLTATNSETGKVVDAQECLINEARDEQIEQELDREGI